MCQIRGTDDIGHIAATALGRWKKLNYANLLASWKYPEEQLNYRFSEPPEVETLEDLKELFLANAEFAAAFGEYLTTQKDISGTI